MKIVEEGFMETISLAERVLMKNPELALKYLSMIPESYIDYSFCKVRIRYLEETAKFMLKR